MENTKSEENRTEAIEHLEMAYEKLLKFAGSKYFDDYKESYQDNILQSIKDIIKVKRNIE